MRGRPRGGGERWRAGLTRFDVRRGEGVGGVCPPPHGAVEGSPRGAPLVVAGVARRSHVLFRRFPFCLFFASIWGADEAMRE